jgi:hypothetical protein
MEKFGSSLTIGFRELFRIIVPGLLGVTFIRFEFGDWNFVKSLDVSFGYLLIVAFTIGLILYVIQPYKWVPSWQREIRKLSNEVKNALGDNTVNFSGDLDHNAEYKYFLETDVERAFVERVHYFTSFYYLLIQIFVLFIVFTITSLVLAFFRNDLLIAYILATIAYLGGAIIFYKSSSSQLRRIIDEQVVMVRIHSDKFKLIQQKLRSNNFKNTLVTKCQFMLNEIVIDPNKHDYTIQCKEQESIDWRTGQKSISYVFQISTLYPLTVGGEPGGYKGFYKERLESVLDSFVSQYNTEKIVYRVFLEIVPNTAEKDTLESLIHLEIAKKNKIVKDNSPVLKIANKYDIKYVLVRGRHLIGPNPGLVQVIEKICDENIVNSALDLFSGTGTVPIVLRKYHVSEITSVDYGKHFKTVKEHLLNKNVTCVEGNVFDYDIKSHYDLIVADPYYEDSVSFLNKRIAEIYDNSKILVFVCCGEQNEYLRKQCDGILRRYYSVNVVEKIVFGQSIFVCIK